ncbi:hypothetical protein SteCoe_31705 [Stentor coeruleus]|uniref:RING-type domain-containing protein n=1 Tax=Stentor coeruleus TaxID=5963 RepID=A0A1R2B0M8_9CILI|nr:hypothetical protein SteCoe_31705 [Stentor coeruleus]
MCNSQCLWTMVNNTICDLECYTKECKFDGDDCKDYCYPGCTNEMRYNLFCDDQCNNEACKYDNFMCSCAPGCYSSFLYNDMCDDVCNVKSCNYDNNQCKEESSTYINMLTIIGFVVIAVSFCLIFFVMIWYYKRRRNENFYRIASVEESGRSNLIEINERIPEIVCPINLLNETCVICLEEFKEDRKIRKLKCEHYFHSECIVQWLLDGRSSNCPLCNTSPFK